MSGGLPARYEDRGTLGDGAMGEVRRVHDRRLGVDVAMKLLRLDLCAREAVRSRFEAEGRLTARLRHPGIVAVHDLGRLDDGRSWFTMQVVEGRTLREVVDGSASRREGAPDGLDTLVGWIADAADALAYAHEQGVVHRDLKPSNLMVGAFGEVLVMDWGVAKGPDLDLGNLEGLTPAPSRHRTLAGRAVGTPPYMSPEQAWAHADRVGPWSDIYALGALLYKVLSGRSPYRGDAMEVLAQVKRGPPMPLREVCRYPVPEALEELVAECMQREPERRPAGAEEVSRRLRAWLDGERRRSAADAFLALAREHADGLAERRARSLGAEARRTARRDEVPTWWSGSPEKAALLEAEVEVRAAHRAVRSAERVYTQYLRAALFEVPDHAEARARLADLYRARAEGEISAGRDPEAVLAQLRLVDDGRHRGWVQGEAWVTLLTFPAGVRVEAFRYEDRAGRMELVRLGNLGTTPLLRVPLGAGSWLLELRAPGAEAVRYPVHLGRLQHLVVKRPGDTTPTLIPLPGPGELRADEVYVPAGWTRIGGGSVMDSFRAATVWVDGFIAARECVTWDEWGTFLDDLRRMRQPIDGLTPVADQAPERGYPGGQASVQVSTEAAVRFIAWRSQRDGLPWRRLHEVEWEKLARGADGRRFPWGDREDVAFVGEVRSPGYRPLVEGASPYGVLGLVDGIEQMGNVWRREGPVDGTVLVPDPWTPGNRLAARGGRRAVPYFQASSRLVGTGSRLRLARSYP